VGSQDNIFLIGYTNDKLGKGEKDENFNAWVGRFDTNGNNKWIQQFGSKKKLDYATGVTTDGTGRVYVTGFTEGLLGTSTNGSDGSAEDAWFAQFDVEKGKLQRFVGDSKDITSIGDPGAIPTIDISNNIVTDDRLPNGDGRIDLTEGTNTSVSLVDYGQIVSGLSNIFTPSSQNSFTGVLRDGIVNNNAPFLSPSDLEFLNGAIA
jgi:Beta-propeller repeat